MSDKENPQDVIESYRKRQQAAQRAPILIGIAAGLLVVGAAVLLFWLLADYGGFLGSIGLAGFNVAFIMAVYEMLPITPMDGKEVKSWKRWVWALFFFPVFALYAWMFLFV